MSDLCFECGRSTTIGNGLFVNRIPDCNTTEEKIDNDVPSPEGEYLCREYDKEDKEKE